MKLDFKKIESKAELINLIRKLCSKDNKSWKNVTTSDFLEAFAAWLEDADGFYKNFQLETNSNLPSWQLFADAFQAATIYE